MPSIDDILAVAEDPAFHRVVTARIHAVRQDLRDEHARLEARLPQLVTDTIDAHPERQKVADRLAEIEAEMEANVLEFRFRALGHRAWADLLRRHPPTKEQLARDRQLDHNPETFPFEAMAASCVDPVMTVEDLARLDRSPLLDVAAWEELWGACLRANVVQPVPKSLAAGLIRRQSGGSATPRTNSASPEVSSSAVS